VGSLGRLSGSELPDGTKLRKHMRSKRKKDKNRIRKGLGRKPSADEEKKAVDGSSQWVDIDDQQTDEEAEWLGELRAPESLPISTRRKR